jgi:hypothetical protein
MRLWQKLWLLFSLIWVIVAALNAVTILVFADEVEQAKAAWPIGLGIAVPAAAYLLLWLWFRFISPGRRKSEK